MEGICNIEKINGEEWVVFNSNFNQELTPDIIEFLSKYQRVEFGEKFDKSVTYQTESSQNRKSPTLLPNSLTHLEYGTYFNQPVDNLPNSVEQLIFGYYFDQPLKSLLSSLKKLIIHEDYEYELPSNIEIKKFRE